MDPASAKCLALLRRSFLALQKFDSLRSLRMTR